MDNKEIIKKILTFSIDNDFADATRREKFADDLRSFIVQGSQESKGFLKAMIGSFYKTEKEPPKPPPVPEEPVVEPTPEEPTTETPEENVPEFPAEETPVETPETPVEETPPEEEEDDFGFGDLSSLASSVKADTNKQESVDFMGFYFN